MQILTGDWRDYQLVDSGDGRRLEKFGSVTLIRPDPQIIWKPKLSQSEWNKADGEFTRTSEDRGNWKSKNPPAGGPERWILKYKNISFYCKLSPFKHTGVFPEQAVHWEFIEKMLRLRGVTAKRDPSVDRSGLVRPRGRTWDTEPAGPRANILNLFGYTGIASLVAAEAGAKVTHVDASYPTIGWARENQKLSGLEDKPIRWIEDDVVKFCEREVRRGAKYDGIIMDPPVYGHGPNSEVWDFNKSFPKLMEICSKLLSDNPLFIIINTYAVSTSAITLENVLKDYFPNLKGNIETGELALKENSGRLLSTGIFTRWSI